MCPIAAFAFYLHHIHVIVGIEQKYDIDWMVNKSWRLVRQTLSNAACLHSLTPPQIRLIHGSNAMVQYN